eukprot:s2471_g10.t1
MHLFISPFYPRAERFLLPAFQLELPGFSQREYIHEGGLDSAEAAHGDTLSSLRQGHPRVKRFRTAVEDEEFPGSRRGRSGTPASAKGARTASSTFCGRRKVSGRSSTLRITDVQRVLPLRQGKLGPVFSYGSSSQGSLVHEAELSFEALLPSGRFCPESFYFVT